MSSTALIRSLLMPFPGARATLRRSTALRNRRCSLPFAAVHRRAGVPATAVERPAACAPTSAERLRAAPDETVERLVVRTFRIALGERVDRDRPQHGALDVVDHGHHRLLRA